MDWWKCHRGAPDDAKFFTVAKRAGVQPSLVASMVWKMFDYSATQMPRGSIAGFDVDGYADQFGEDAASCWRAFAAMQALARPLHDGVMLLAWDKRQAQSAAAIRQKEYRDRKRAKSPKTVTRNITRDAQRNGVMPRYDRGEVKDLSSALDVASAVTPPTIESVTVRNTEQAATDRAHTQGIEQDQKRGAGWVGRALRRLGGAP